MAKEEEKKKEDDNNLTRETNGMPTLTPPVRPWTPSREPHAGHVLRRQLRRFVNDDDDNDEVLIKKEKHKELERLTWLGRERAKR